MTIEICMKSHISKEESQDSNQSGQFAGLHAAHPAAWPRAGNDDEDEEEMVTMSSMERALTALFH